MVGISTCQSRFYVKSNAPKIILIKQALRAEAGDSFFILSLAEREIYFDFEILFEGVSQNASKTSIKEQARCHACVSGVTKLPWRNRLMLNLRAYFVLYVISITWIMYVHERIRLSSIPQKLRFELN